MGHLFERGGGLEFLQPHLGELGAIELILAVRRLDIEDTHDAVAVRERLDGIIRSDEGRTQEFLGGLGLYRLERGRPECKLPMRLNHAAESRNERSLFHVPPPYKTPGALLEA